MTIKLKIFATIVAVLAAALVQTSAFAGTISDSSVSSEQSVPSDSRIRGIYRQYDESAVIPPAKAPADYKLVYITHYGRHGARYVEKAGEYDKLLKPLQKASGEGNLTPLGASLLEEYLPLYNASLGHIGELTDLGQAQHRGIAERMVKSHSRLFGKGVRIEARSSNLERTMLSMLAFCNTVQALVPSATIHADAPVATIHTINPHSVDSRLISAYDLKCRHKNFYADFLDWGRRNVKPDGLMQRLFKDADAAARAVGMDAAGRIDFMNALFTIACAANGMDSPDNSGPGNNKSGCGGPDFFRYLTSEELEALSRWDNMFYYFAKGPGYTPCSRNWAVSKYILEDFILRAEEDIAGGVSARLRFGHDGCLMALFCLMNLDGWNTVADSTDSIWDVWDISRVPMASNIQIDFWRNSDGDMLIHPRYNERPLKLPIDETVPGFYSWKAFKEHYMRVIDDATAILEKTAALK